MRKYIFICIANDNVGFGHLSRMLALASVFGTSGGDADFLVFGSESARNHVIRSGYRCFFYEWTENSRGWSKDRNVDYDLSIYSALIADLSHPIFFSFLSEDRDKKFILLLERFDRVKVVIDSVVEQSFLERFPTVRPNFQVVPYVTDEVLPFGSWDTLRGPRYAVLAEITHGSIRKRFIREKADRILVTCGGSDPTRLTTRVMEAVEMIADLVELKVVIGPLFSRESVENVINLASFGRQRVKIVNSPTSLLDLMCWCDVAVATTGLTKYELAATGTPAIALSIDSFHDRVNQPFAKFGSVVDIGYQWTEELLAKEIDQLRRDHEKRKNMSRAGQEIVDGCGANRILKEIEVANQC